MTLQKWERQHILSVLTKTQWDLQKTAHLLQITMAELRQKLKQHGLEQSQCQDQNSCPTETHSDVDGNATTVTRPSVKNFSYTGLPTLDQADGKVQVLIPLHLPK